MEEQIAAFLNYLQNARGSSRNTLAAYRNDLRQFLNFATNEQPHLSNWNRVDKPLLLSFILHLKDRDYTSSSVSRKVAVLKTFYHYLTQQGVVIDDPTATLDSPKVVKPLPQVLSLEEVGRLLRAPVKEDAKGIRDRAMLELMYATGVRVSELVALNLADVNLENKTLHCAGSGGKRRVILISDRAADALRAYWERGRAGFLPKPEEPALFLNPKGERLTRQGLWLIIHGYVMEAGIRTNVTPHTLRHSFAAHALNRGEGLENIQRVLGHSNITTTQVYARLKQAADAAK